MMRQLSFPDGLTVFSLNADETRFVHREVFGERCYLRHGIELRDGDCVFDVGANIGLSSLFFHREREGVRIFAFEPSPAACECLRANMSSRMVRMTRARGGTSVSEAFSMAWQKAVPWEKAESPEMLSARNTARWMAMSSNSFSVPLWV